MFRHWIRNSINSEVITRILYVKGAARSDQVKYGEYSEYKFTLEFNNIDIDLENIIMKIVRKGKISM